ncbi:translocation/assembly module TamB domain-containing protein [Thioflexithrix psekupsensis]|uniref:Translocation and assembly module TamB C-terminal domain-containing protein n=1 Tax=Thioflexithrix psekupsensis TaxID=1570016 RepID=A0A251X4N2_9GAMM|nr:translocation/assembly module TamB domain-containing protein [Thioflexithrix psekupsensis]OUD11669.1 hypothetical protein TPSD3_16575 [Thioflexithrix psekupsensis]
MRLLKYGFFGLLITFFLFVIVAGVGTGTNAGSNWLIKNVGHALGGELEIERIEGHLLDELSLHQVRYRRGELSVNAEQIKWAWQPSALFRGLLHINRIELQQVTLILPPSREDTPPNDTPFEMPEIRLPIKAQIDALIVQQFTLHHHQDQPPFILDHASLQARVDQQLFIEQLRVKTPEFNSELDLSGQFELLRPHALQLALQARADLPEAPATTLALTAQGQLAAINTEIKIDGYFPLLVQATIESVLTDPQWKLAVMWDELKYPIAAPEYFLKNGKIEAKGDLKTYQISSQLSTAVPQLPAVQWQFKGTGDLNQFRLENLLAKLPQGDVNLQANVQWLPELQADFNFTAKELAIAEYWPPELPAINANIKGQFAQQQLTVAHLQLDLPNNTQLKAQADIKLDNPADPYIDAVLNWQELRWPPTGTPLASLPKGQAEFKGTPSAYLLNLITDLMGQDIPKSKINLTAKGSTQEAKIETLKIDVLKGQINTQGNVQWLPHVKWNLAVKGQQIKPETQWPEFPGTLALNLTTEGQLIDKLQAQLELTQLKGQLRGYPLDLTLTAQANGDRYQIQQLKFRSGENQLTAKADYQQQLTAEWTLDLRRLAALLPNAQGQLSSKGTISGNPQSPHIKAHIKGEKLGFDELTLQQLAVDMEANLGKPDSPLNLNLLLKQLHQADELLLSDASIVGTGTIKQHQIKLNAKAPMQDVALQLNGGLKLDQLDWQGQWQQLQVKFKENLAKAGEWQLQQASPLSFNGKKTQVQLQDFCLRQKNNNMQFCLTAQHDSKNSQLDFRLKELSLNVINPDLTGTIQGELTANYRPNGQIAANGQFRVSPGAFVTEIEEGRRQQLKYEGGMLELSINETGLTSRLDFKLLQHSALQGRLHLPGFNRLPLSEQQTLNAQLMGDIGDLALISIFVPMLEEVKGKLSLNVSAEGLLKQPLIQGKVRLSEAQLNVPLLGMELRDLYANIDSDLQTLGLLKIDIGARSGNGNLNIIGQANPLTQQVDLTLQGDQFRLLNNVDAFVVISPNINVKVKEENVNITGTLTIPEANITPNMVVSDGSTSVGGAVRASQDVVIINDPNATEESKILGIAEQLKLSMNLLVKLGDTIHVDAVGFKSQVKGQIRLTHRPQDIELLPIANGELQIINGTFRSYGQDLEIDRGRVIFANTIVTKPELNIKAVRRIYGDQKVEAAGVHITGNPEKINLDLFSQPSMPQDQIISYLLTGKGFDPSNPDHTIGWGTYILPNLYISYGISLLNQSNIFSVRYELNKTWGVEINIAEEDKGIDFSYTLER